MSHTDIIYDEMIKVVWLASMIVSNYQYMGSIKYLTWKTDTKQARSIPHLSLFITLSFLAVFISSPDTPFPPPPPLNITALILPLHVQIFESAVKSLNHTNQSPRYYRSTEDLRTSALIWTFSRRIPSLRIYQIKAFLILGKYSPHPLAGWQGRLVS